MLRFLSPYALGRVLLYGLAERLIENRPGNRKGVSSTK